MTLVPLSKNALQLIYFSSADSVKSIWTKHEWHMAIALRQTEMFCDLTELNRENYKIDLDVSKTTTRTSVSTNAKGRKSNLHLCI